MGSGLAAGSGSALFCSDASRFPGASGTSVPDSSPAASPVATVPGQVIRPSSWFHPLPPSVAENPGLCHAQKSSSRGSVCSVLLLPPDALFCFACGEGMPFSLVSASHRAESHAGRWVVQVRPGSGGSRQEFKPARAPQHPRRGYHGLADPGPQDAEDLTASSLQMHLRLGLLGLQRVCCLGLGA